ncbi:DUF11 domain-containing protein [Amycolatopsis dongchuanensis]|uniref:DUF11 domain-containing protein n=2 Tax=Amycolatopsis TaxID=1813 RepID=A0ABP8VP37_9PSEU
MSRIGRRLARLGSLLAVGGLAALAAVVSAPGAGAQTAASCGYGAGGPSASTLCWINMANYNDTQARSSAGQNMTMRLPGGYTMTFNVINRPQGTNAFRPLRAAAVPTWGPAYLGNRAYRGIPGQPALMANAGGTTGVWVDVVTLRNIVVRDSAGAQVTGYALVGADAEATAANEGITWRSNQRIDLLARLSPGAGAGGCQNSVTGLGTTTVSCAGANSTNGTWGTVLVKSVGATSFSQTLQSTGGGEGVAFAVMTSKLTLTKSVASRVRPSDSFDLRVTSPEGTLAGSARTGTAATATTGTLTVLPRANGGRYTLSEAATAGSSLASYSQAWTCRNATTGSTTVLPSGAGTSKAVAPQPGDDITCTITNTPLPVDLAIVKAATPEVNVGGTVTYLLVVTNNGRGDSSGYTVTDQIPAGLTNVSSSTAGCSVSGSTLTCTGGLLPAGQSRQITVTGTADGTVDLLRNTATVRGVQPDPVPANNTSNAAVTVVTVPMVAAGFAGVLGLFGGGWALRRRLRRPVS